MNHVGFQLTGKILNDERVMRALVDANTATDAEAFGDVRLSRLVVHDDAFLPVSNRWAEVMALIVALLGLTIVLLQDGNTHAITKPSYRQCYFVSPAHRREIPTNRRPDERFK
jgi:hypothetical protein